MFEKVIHQIDRKRTIAPSSKVYGKIWVSLTQKSTFLRGFILKPTKKTYILLKNSPRDFQNSPSFERLAGFYVTITGKLWTF